MSLSYFNINTERPTNLSDSLDKGGGVGWGSLV